MANGSAVFLPTAMYSFPQVCSMCCRTNTQEFHELAAASKNLQIGAPLYLRFKVEDLAEATFK
jgi:hypothetical protein